MILTWLVGNKFGRQVLKHFHWFVFPIYGFVFAYFTREDSLNVDLQGSETVAHFITEEPFGWFMVIICLIIWLSYLIPSKKRWVDLVRGISTSIYFGSWLMITIGSLLGSNGAVVVGAFSVPLVLHIGYRLWLEPRFRNKGGCDK